MTARNEALDTPITVTWKGKTYKVVPASKWTIEVLEAVEDGKVTYILRTVLEDDGYARFRATKPLASEVAEFFEKISEKVASGN